AIMLDTHRRQERYGSTCGRNTSSSIGEHESDNAILCITTHFDVIRTDHNITGRQGDRVSRLWPLTGIERAGRDSQGTRTEGHAASRKRRGAEPGQREQRSGSARRKEESECDRVVANTWIEDRAIRDRKLRWE